MILIMAVTSMRLVTVTGQLGRLDSVLDVCAEKGDFHFEQAMSFFGGKSDFAPINDENPYTQCYTRLYSALSDAGLEILQPEECGEAEIPQTLESVEAFIGEATGQLAQTAGKKQELSRQAERISGEIEQLRHFSGLDIKLSEIFECEFIKVRFGRLPRSSYNRLKYYSDNPYIMMLACESDGDYVYGVYFSPIDSVAEVDRIFQSLLWERLHLPDAKDPPAEECAAMEQRVLELNAEAQKASEELAAWWELNKYPCSLLCRGLERRKESFELRRYVARYKTGDQFFLAGWVTADDKKDLKQRLSKIEGIDCDIEKPAPGDGHAPPVKLKNRGFAKPFEFYVSMYGLPEYGEIDPTPFVAVTYFLLFGMMFADVGQGLLLSLVGWIYMWKKKHMELGRIVGVCGFSSAIFGVLLGSVFGFEDWLNGFWGWVHQKTGVPLDGGKLINIENSSTVTTLIYATVGIGAALMLCAMLLNIYARLKQKQWGAALFSPNGVAGLVFYGSVVYAAVNALLLGNPLPGGWFIPVMVGVPLILIFLQEPLGALLAREEHWLPESPVDFIFQNVFELFEVLLSYVSNTVSFLRVGAFILVHYGMMTVVFTIAEFNPVGSVGYYIVVVLGNILIMVLEGLLVGIQALRLEFYEMFSRFYSGSGRPFIPVGAKVKQN